jgi:glycosyltransferase involved in cell wall biosynthesis
MNAGLGHRSRKVLFANRCEFPSGGCIKMRDYFRHALTAPGWDAKVYIPPDNFIGPDNPWYGELPHIVRQYAPYEADVLVISGLGWERFIPEEIRNDSPIPIIYLIQGAFKAYTSPYREDLRHLAIRIAVSPHIADTVRSRADVNGPLFVVPAGLDTQDFPPRVDPHERDIDLLILGIKNAPLAAQLGKELTPYIGSMSCLVDQIPQVEFLGKMARARIVVCLPGKDEGFYLPALEAMHYGALVVCPDVGGNRHFCLDYENCLVPQEYSLNALLKTIHKALELSRSVYHNLTVAARLTADLHTAARERAAFIDILQRARDLWLPKHPYHSAP